MILNTYTCEIQLRLKLLNSTKSDFYIRAVPIRPRVNEYLIRM